MDSSEKEQGLAEHHADVDHQVVDRPSSAMGHHEGEEEDQPMGWAVWMAIIVGVVTPTLTDELSPLPRHSLTQSFLGAPVPV